ncbi:MAG: sulfatase-like hydrolase/transferase [Verrucomicrobiales bacterium]
MFRPTESHESSLHFSPSLMEKEPTKTDPATVTLAPYHPDTPVFRYTHARYLDRMGVIDQKVGELVAQLSEDGLLEDTFIFYFGDHGGVLPRAKVTLRERTPCSTGGPGAGEMATSRGCRSGIAR